jgi:hypothetical protein
MSNTYNDHGSTAEKEAFFRDLRSKVKNTSGTCRTWNYPLLNCEDSADGSQILEKSKQPSTRARVGGKAYLHL